MISHLNKKNKPTIVDISKKKVTTRNAIAEGTIQFSKSTFKKIESLKTKKGEIKSIAIIAGIIAAKIPNLTIVEILGVTIIAEGARLKLGKSLWRSIILMDFSWIFSLNFLG